MTFNVRLRGCGRYCILPEEQLLFVVADFHGSSNITTAFTLTRVDYDANIAETVTVRNPVLRNVAQYAVVVLKVSFTRPHCR